MKCSVAKSQLSVGMLVGLALLVSNHVVGCGDASSDTPDPNTGTDTPGSQNGGSQSSSSTGGGSATSGTPTTEGSPNNIQLDPNRDQTMPINLVASGAVQCGGAGNYCVQPNLTCCTTAGMMGGNASNSCAANAAACPGGTTSSASCSSVASCAAGRVCCRTGGGGGGGTTTSTCETSCAMGSVQVCLDDAECGTGNQCNNNNTCGPIACTATSCGGGQLCCRNQGGGNGGNNVAACVAPGGDGLCPNNQRQVCTTDADCPATFTCPAQGGNNNGGGRLCTPPPCTTTSCVGGQICCVGGQIGGNATCSAANAGACPGNSRLLCVVDADCATAAGTFCLTAPNGGNAQLSCRVPPPPPADAGAGDAG